MGIRSQQSLTGQNEEIKAMGEVAPSFSILPLSLLFLVRKDMGEGQETFAYCGGQCEPHEGWQNAGEKSTFVELPRLQQINF